MQARERPANWKWTLMVLVYNFRSAIITTPSWSAASTWPTWPTPTNLAQTSQTRSIRLHQLTKHRKYMVWRASTTIKQWQVYYTATNCGPAPSNMLLWYVSQLASRLDVRHGNWTSHTAKLSPKPSEAIKHDVWNGQGCNGHEYWSLSRKVVLNLV